MPFTEAISNFYAPKWPELLCVRRNRSERVPVASIRRGGTAIEYGALVSDKEQRGRFVRRTRPLDYPWLALRPRDVAPFLAVFCAGFLARALPLAGLETFFFAVAIGTILLSE
jgi:hypothetical protein